MAEEGGLEESAESAHALKVLEVAGIGFGIAVDPFIPIAHDNLVARRSLYTIVTLRVVRPVPSLVGADPCGVSLRYPVERRPPTLGAAQGA